VGGSARHAACVLTDRVPPRALQINDIYQLLNENYVCRPPCSQPRARRLPAPAAGHAAGACQVEDDDNMFRFDYSIAFLRWVAPRPQRVRLVRGGGRGVSRWLGA
jgi:hypothetical protein